MPLVVGSQGQTTAAVAVATASPAISDNLRVAAIKGRTDKVVELLQAGALCDVADRDGRTALHFACHCGHVDIVSALIEAGSDVNTPDFSGYTALQRAATEGHSDVVQELLKHGAQVDHQDDVHGNTALHEAAWKGFSQTIEILCKFRANAYIKNKGGFVPLHLVCQNGHNQSGRVLLWSGCRPDIKNNYGDTPLHTAARYGHAGVMRILISARCNVDERNKNGDTAVHISSAMGRRKLTRILLESHCDLKIQNKQGETAMDIARRKRFAEVGNILANPPSAVTGDAAEMAGKQQNKKREKESGTSKDSKDSGSRHKAGKTKKSKRGHKGSHGRDKYDSKTGHGHGSPYGCRYYKTTATTGVMPIQNLKLDTLPDEPLSHGEQYFVDLAGNIRKGPVGVGYACYCVPFFRNVEKKMENDKQELMEHIDIAHDNLNAKITHLERRTRSQLTTINEGMKERMAADKAECLDKVDRVIRATAAGLDSSRTILSGRQRPPTPGVASSSSSSSEEDDDNEDVVVVLEGDRDRHDVPGRVAGRSRGPPPPSLHLAAEVALAARASSEVQFRRRSKSEEVLSEDTSSKNPNALRKNAWTVLKGNAVGSKFVSDVALAKNDIATSAITVAGVVVHRDAGAMDDRDSGYTTKLHSSFESSSTCVQVPRLPPKTLLPNPSCVSPVVVVADGRSTDEFEDIEGQFFYTVNHETEKWYERRLQSLERRTAVGTCEDDHSGPSQQQQMTMPPQPLPRGMHPVPPCCVPRVRGIADRRFDHGGGGETTNLVGACMSRPLQPAGHIHTRNTSSLV